MGELDEDGRWRTLGDGLVVGGGALRGVDQLGELGLGEATRHALAAEPLGEG